MGFGKVYRSLWEGSLIGRPEPQLVFVFLLAHADARGTADVSPRMLHALTGLSLEAVRAALEFLEAPDPESRTPDEGGRRIVRLAPEVGAGWRIVNYSAYRNARSPEDRREQNRRAQRDRRARLAGEVKAGEPGPAEVKGADAAVNVIPLSAALLTNADNQPRSAQAEAEAEAEQTDSTPATNPDGGMDMDALGEYAADEADTTGPDGSALPNSHQATWPDPFTEGVLSPEWLTYPLKARGIGWVLRIGQVEEWERAFPGLDVRQQCRNAHAWCVANPGKRKTAAGMPRFLARWLTKAHNDAASGGRHARARTDAGYAQQVRVIGGSGE